MEAEGGGGGGTWVLNRYMYMYASIYVYYIYIYFFFFHIFFFLGGGGQRIFYNSNFLYRKSLKNIQTIRTFKAVVAPPPPLHSDWEPCNSPQSPLSGLYKEP